jgi:hypothetical protein
MNKAKKSFTVMRNCCACSGAEYANDDNIRRHTSRGSYMVSTFCLNIVQ